MKKWESRKAIGAFLRYSWQYFLLVLVGAVGINVLIYYLVHTAKYEQTLSIFVASRDVQAPKLENDLMDAVFQDSSIKKVSVDYSNPDEYDFSLVFSTRGTVNTDIIILPLARFEPVSFPTYFIDLAPLEGEAFYTGTNKTENEGVVYGLGLPDKISTYFSIDGYALFLNKKSEKIGKVSPTSKNETAIEALRWIYG